jgi:hypothetical protein
MKRLFCLLMAIGLLGAWSWGGQKIKRTVEGGVEIVLNPIDPYRLPGEPSSVVLEREFVIDAEDPELLKSGLTDILRFGVGNDGSIYLAQRPRKDVPVVFKFDKAGRLRASFGRFGQGPGEIERCSYFGVLGRDEIYVLDVQGRRIATFDPSGELTREARLPASLLGAIPLENGNYLSPRAEAFPTEGQEEVAFDLLDRRCERIKAMHSFRFPMQPMGAERLNAYLTNPVGSFDTDRIYLGLPGREYELRKIRKVYEPVAVTAAFREAALSRLPQGSPVVGRLEFPDHKPSFQSIFSDEKGRIFVSTSEVDKTSGQNICDIFNAAGVFIGRAAIGYFDLLKMYWEGSSLDVVAKNGRFYVLHEKENGYKELIVSRAVWR